MLDERTVTQKLFCKWKVSVHQCHLEYLEHLDNTEHTDGQ